MISLTETWNPEQKKHNFNPKILDRYNEYIGTTGTTARGGCGFYINKDLNYIERKDLNFKFKANDEECESFWVELLNLNSPDTLLGVIYRHPSENDTLFTEELQKTLIKIKKEKKGIVISGDFNLDLLLYDKNEMISNFLNTIPMNNPNKATFF